MSWRGDRRGFDFAVAEAICCEGGSRCFATVSAMAQSHVYRVPGKFIYDFSTKTGTGGDWCVSGCHSVGLSFLLSNVDNSS